MGAMPVNAATDQYSEQYAVLSTLERVIFGGGHGVALKFIKLICQCYYATGAEQRHGVEDPGTKSSDGRMSRL